MSEIVDLLSVALVHFLWQGCVIALALGLVLRLTPSNRSGLRYLLSLSALALMALMPLATVVTAMDSDSLTPTAPIVSKARTTLLANSTAIDTKPGTESPLPASVSPLLTEPLRTGIVSLWLLGVLAFTAIHTGGWLQIRRLRLSGVPVQDPAWEPWIAGLRDRLGIKRWVAVLASTRVDVPTLLGTVKPVVLVPASALVGLSPSSLEALLLHELAHVRRHDFLVNLLQAAVETLLFYHPAVWWVSRTVRYEREHCCDDLALSLCDSRRDYVQALTEMERHRLATPRMGVAADGGSLVERIRRLTGSTSSQQGAGARWALGVGIIALALSFGALQLVSLPTADARTPQDGLNPAAGDAIEGWWTARVRDDGVQLELRRPNRRTSDWVELSEFSGTGNDGIPGFHLVRDAGTFYFEGSLADPGRDSRFEFRGNPDYAKRMRSIGFDAPASTRRLYELASLDVSLAFAEGIRDAGYGDIGIKRLIEFRIHGVTPEFVEKMGEAGSEDLPPSRLVEFRIHGVTPEFVRGMAESGLDGMSASRLVEFRIHGVTPEFVREMAASGLEELSPSRLVEFRIHGVSAEFVQELMAVGLDGMSASRLVEFRIHGVTPEFVRGMKHSGIEDLSPSRFVEFRIHGVSPSFVEEMTSLGLEGLSASRLVEMRIHGVSAEFVRRAQARYDEELTVRDLIEMRIHGREFEVR